MITRPADAAHALRRPEPTGRTRRVRSRWRRICPIPLWALVFADRPHERRV